MDTDEVQDMFLSELSKGIEFDSEDYEDEYDFDDEDEEYDFLEEEEGRSCRTAVDCRGKPCVYGRCRFEDFVEALAAE